MKRQSVTAAVGCLILLCGFPLSAGAYRDYFTDAQKKELGAIQTVLVEALALTDKGAGNSGGILDVAMKRMGELGYAAVSDPRAVHDVVVRVKCEQRKTWEGTASAGGDNDLPDAPSRLWKGPACQITYALGGMKIKWQKEVRTEFQDSVEAAQAAQAPDPGLYAMNALRDALGT